MGIRLPEWLFTKIINSPPDAYDSLAPELRARLKSQIAFLHQCLGESAPWRECCRPWLDRSLEQRDEPADWVLCGIAESLTSAPGLLAALMPAILAGCGKDGREIVVCRIVETGLNPLPLELSAALELIGQEQVFELSASDLTVLFADLAGQAPGNRGRVALLGDFAAAGDDRFAGLLLEACRRGIPVAALPGRVKIFVDAAHAVDGKLLRWAQPSAEIAEARPETVIPAEAARQNGWTALLSPRPQAFALAPNLWLAPGNEAFWLWPELEPAFFRARRAGIGRMPG